MLLVLATANAQTSQPPRSQETQMLAPEQRAKSKSAVEHLPEGHDCDSHGCYFEEMKKRRAASELQNDLQRRAEEARKKLLAR